MLELLGKLSTVEDRRQEKKVRHKMSDIIAIVLFASLANANEWIEIYGNTAQKKSNQKGNKGDIIEA